MSRPDGVPFEDSRRLTGPNWQLEGPGATLECEATLDDEQLADWRSRVTCAATWLGWPSPQRSARRHASGTTLSLSAPVDQLFCATEVNEWALGCALRLAAPLQPGWPSNSDDEQARRCLRQLSAAERDAELIAILGVAGAAGVPVVLDDEVLSLGLGVRSISWSRQALPAVSSLPSLIGSVGRIPLALVTGSNGKTTTVRLIVAMLKAHGLRPGFSCTDGVFIDGAQIHSGDYSGPAGARAVLRSADVTAAVLETARGGILRRGLAVERCDVAVVTNVSADHFGEYGVDDLASLAEVKRVVSKALDADGLLVLNADDPSSLASPGHAATVAWFSLDDGHPKLVAHRASGGLTCAVRSDRMLLSQGGVSHDLGSVAAMPLSANGVASYNIANIAAAALAAFGLGLPIQIIASVLQHFGHSIDDNPGRLERHEIGGIRLLMDYAHNPAGLDGLLSVARAERGTGRVGLLLGQAGNRLDADLGALAAVAAEHAPDLFVLKGIDGYGRGRLDDETAHILRSELQRRGVDDSRLRFAVREIDAVREAMSWARPGDLLVLPVHALSAKRQFHSLLDRLSEQGWSAGDQLPGAKDPGSAIW